MSQKTTDLSDKYSDLTSVAEPGLQNFGGVSRFSGQIVTVKVWEDNPLVREALSEDGSGKVLVVDGGGSLACALLGDQVAELAIKNHWSGILVYGCVRDTERLRELKLGVRALAPHPKKSGKQGLGSKQIPVTFLRATFKPGSYVYVDEDGILVSDRLWID